MPSSIAPTFADEVDHGLGAVPVGELPHLRHVRPIHDDGVVGPKLLRERECCLGAIHHDDLRRRQGLEALDGDVTQAACPDHDRLRAGIEDRRRFLHRVVGGEARVGESGHVLRLQSGIELHQRSRGGLEQVGEAAVDADAREPPVAAVHVVRGAARAAEAARHEGVDDDGVADGDVGDGGAHLVDPARVLVAERVRKLDPALLLPLALDNVQVGAAEACPADPHDDVERVGGPRLLHLLENELLVIVVQPRCLHRCASSPAESA
jgi:hypothetical protein